MEGVHSTSQSSSPAKESTCKTQLLVQAGMWRQALLIKLSETGKKSISYVVRAEYSPVEEFVPVPKGDFPHFDCMNT